MGKTLENITLFDVYEGNQIESGKKSVAFSLKLRSKDKTLTDDDADSAMKKRLRLLKSSAQLSEAEKTADKIQKTRLTL